MSIHIPRNFSDILSQDPDVQANVSHLCSNAAGLFTLNPDFFPDYTFHGMDHINEVLDHADHLIPGKTRNILMPRDIAFLVCAIVIHDLGMFLAEDGARRLIAGDLRQQLLDGFEDDTWEKAWDSYTDRVRRYPQEKMRHLFGGNIIVDPACVSRQPIDSDNDRRVIGEFLRQQHPRLAHEIAVKCFPGDKDTNIFENTSFDEDDRDMIGLLARSHGLAIRDTEDYCEEYYESGSKPCNIPIFYLMAVLRIADLLDAGSHRAPNIRLDAKKIRIPISAEEWTWNQRITPRKCKWDTEKSKRHIFADPTTSIEYVQLDQWLSRLQTELDLSWSVLSEKYPTEDYRLSIHRVTSNIRETGIRKRMNENFLTREARVTANPEIVKLMMEPLYGDDPSYGVRELLQNAVDACIERESKEGSSYKGKVTVRVDKDYFTISDNGIGMDENVLLNYYLSAGSSFRNSDEWKQDFTENGEARIARTGRFGVGFLASFLLGDEITVHTQHMEDKKGYIFSFDRESSPRNVKRLQRSDGAGTTITIQLKKGVYEKLKWSTPGQKRPDSASVPGHDPLLGSTIADSLSYEPQVRWTDWYIYRDPAVEYYLDGELVRLYLKTLPRSMEAQHDWFSLPTKDFHGYYWRPIYSYDRGFYCNGIKIDGGCPYDLRDYGLDVEFPRIVLNDRNNHLKVNLARSRIEEIPCREELLKQISLYEIARLLMTDWDSPEACTRNFTKTKYLLSTEGFSLLSPAFVQSAGNPECFHLFYDGENSMAALNSAVASIPAGTFFRISLPFSISVYNKLSPSAFLADGRYGYSGFINRWSWKRKAIYTSEALLTTLDKAALAKLDYPDGLIQDGIYRDNPYEEGFPFDLQKFDLLSFPIVVRMAVEYPEYRPVSYAFHRILCELLECAPDSPWIPFDMEERKKKFPKAFRELKPYMDHISKFGLYPYFLTD